jgi:DNA-binding SARP family transcriptional activator
MAGTDRQSIQRTSGARLAPTDLQDEPERAAESTAAETSLQHVLQEVLAEQEALSQTVERFVDAVHAQQAHLGQRLAAAVELLGTGRSASSTSTPGTQPASAPLAPGPALPEPPAAAAPAGPPVLPERSGVTSAHDGVPRATVFCLGVFAVEIGGRRVDNWQGRKTRALFQYLVNHRDRPVPREALVSALWPEPDRLAANTSLKVSVHALRQTLAQAQGAEPLLSVVGHEYGYQLETIDVWVDVEEFERACAAARRLEAEGRHADAIAWDERAVQLYGGDFLGECWDDWVVFRREALKDRYLHALARLAEAALEARDHQSCIAYCQKLLDQDRCREDTYRTLMLCHARLGQRDRVRRWYELCVRTLREEIDVDPDPETTDAYARALRGAACSAAREPAITGQ